MDEDEMHDSLVVEEGIIVKFPFVTVATFAAPASRFFFSQKEEVKQPHCRDTQRPNIMNYLVTPEALDHLPLTTLHVCQNSVTTVARAFQESPACLNTCWWSMEPAIP